MNKYANLNRYSRTDVRLHICQFIAITRQCQQQNYKNELINKVKGEAYFTYTLTLYGVLHVARVRPSPDTHLHKLNMNEQLKLSTIFRRNTCCCCKFRIIRPNSMNYFIHIMYLRLIRINTKNYCFRLLTVNQCLRYVSNVSKF